MKRVILIFLGVIFIISVFTVLILDLAKIGHRGSGGSVTMPLNTQLK